VTVLARGAQVAAKGGWERLPLISHGKWRWWPSSAIGERPIIVAVFDRDHPESIANKEAKCCGP